MSKKILFIIILLIVGIMLFVKSYIKYGKVEQTVGSIEVEKVFYDPEYNTDLISSINTYNINNDEIKSKYQFVFLSDLHMSVIDDNEPNEKIKTSLKERQEMFYINKAKPEDYLNEIVKYTNNKNADALLLVGDIIDSPADANLREFKEKLGLLKTKYLYTFGNHDWTFAWNYQTKETEEEFVPKFKDIMNDSEVDYIEYEDLIVLAINNGKSKIEGKNIKKIKDVLEKKKPTIVMMHIPIATEHLVEINKKYIERISVIGEGGIAPNEDTQEVLDLILSNEYKVIFIISGHVHIGMEDTINGKIPEVVCRPAYEGNINLLRINN